MSFDVRRLPREVVCEHCRGFIELEPDRPRAAPTNQRAHRDLAALAIVGGVVSLALFLGTCLVLYAAFGNSPYVADLQGRLSATPASAAAVAPDDGSDDLRLP